MLTKEERFDWLRSLTVGQLRALGCQREVDDWQSMVPTTLINRLMRFDDIDEPVEG